MSKQKNMIAKAQSLATNSKNSRNSKTGYMDTGNSSKLAAKEGTRNKN